MARAYFLAVFAPEGWPSSVAPEYGRYQLWDTIQQAGDTNQEGCGWMSLHKESGGYVRVLNCVG